MSEIKVNTELQNIIKITSLSYDIKLIIDSGDLWETFVKCKFKSPIEDFVDEYESLSKLSDEQFDETLAVITTIRNNLKGKIK